jgi:CHAT domain-containing protein
MILLLESHNELASMQISTNSPIFPWEIVFPDKRGNGSKPEFFGIAFRIARWSVRNSISQLEDPVPLLKFAELHTFAPPYTDEASLPAQQREITSLKRAKGFQMHESNFKSLKLLMGTHIEGFVHFAGHGDYEPVTRNAPLYSIMLSDGVLDPSTWRQMSQGADFGNPFVFFNACDTGRSRSYGGFVQGWGPVILSTGAGGFLGAMWPLLDDAAADFAQGFYDQLGGSKDEGGVFVADALRDVRRRFYTTGDPTYLAYVFYGNANLRVLTPPQ